MATSPDSVIYPPILYGVGQTWDSTTSTGPVNAGAVCNYTHPAMLRWRRAVARVRDGSGRGRLLVIGDSTSMGTGAGSGGTGNLNGAFTKAWPQALAGIPNTTIPISSQSIIGNQATQVAYNTYDPRLVQGTGWVPTSSASSLGFAMWTCPNGTSSALAFTPSGQFDNFTIYYIRQGVGMGSFATSIDSDASLGTTNTLGANAMLSVSYAVTKGNHTIKVTAQGDGVLIVAGIVAWNSTAPAIDLLQGAWFGAKAANFASGFAVWSPLNAIAIYAPDLTIINLTINDSNQGTDLPTYTAQMQQIITAAQASGDVLLMVGAPSDTLQATDGTLEQFIGALHDLAVKNNCALLSMKTRWVSYAAVDPVLPYYDDKHPGALGYQDMAQAVSGVLGML